MFQNDKDMIEFILWCLHEFDVVEGGSIQLVKNGSLLRFGKTDSISL